jgi:hypothetical protein
MTKKRRSGQQLEKPQFDFKVTEKVYLDFWRLERMYELYSIYCDHKLILKQVLWFIRQLKKRKDISISNFKDVLSVLDNNKAFRDELDYFGKNIMPKFVKNNRPADDVVMVY